MEQYSIFDIIGPVMVGPSSSHTAGASRLGYIARMILDEPVRSVNFTLHGSFAKTYQGHGTDKALLGGILGFLPDDERMKSAHILAEQEGISYAFEAEDLGEVHPNTVKIQLVGKYHKQLKIVGSSIGAGKVKVIQIGEIEVALSGELTTLLTHHLDQPGVVAEITATLAEESVNIAFMKLYRHNKGEKAIMVMETDEDIPTQVLDKVKRIKAIKEVQLIKKMEV